MNVITKKWRKLFHKGPREVNLLLKLLEEYESKFSTGLCLFIYTLWVQGNISIEQWGELSAWIEENPPSSVDQDGFWFERGDLEVRIKYLKTFV